MSHNNEKNPDNVIRGLKASIHNDNVSDEAKENAAQRLEQMGAEVPADYALRDDDDHNGKLNSNRARGYKSALSRDDVSDEAKEHAREMLKSDAEYDDSAETDEVHHGGETNRVLGGYKAALKNPNVSDEAKEHAQQVLDEAYD